MYVRYEYRSLWPRSLRRWSKAARLLGMLVRIPPRDVTLVNVVCWEVEVTASGRSLVLGESYRVWCV